MDIAKIIEPFCNFTLTDWQKEYAQKLFDDEMEGNHLMCIPPRNTQMDTTKFLQAIVIYIVGVEKGLINPNGDSIW